MPNISVTIEDESTLYSDPSGIRELKPCGEVIWEIPSKKRRSIESTRFSQQEYWKSLNLPTGRIQVLDSAHQVPFATR